MSDGLVDALIFLFNRILKDTINFSPSSKKFHYQFNFRELAKVCEGMCRSTPQQYKDPFNVLRLFQFECKRVFEDRFINQSDQMIFRKYLHEGIAKFFGEPDEKNSPLAEPCMIAAFVAAHQGLDP